METAILAVIAAVIGGSVAGGLMTTWRVHRRLLVLEDVSNELERITTRETKSRAAKERWAKPPVEQEIMEYLKHTQPETVKKLDNEW